MTPKQSRAYILSALKRAERALPALDDDAVKILAEGMEAFLSEYEPRMLSPRDLQRLVAEAFHNHGALMVAAIKPTLMVASAVQNAPHPVP